ncbi:MAG: hypothetical protein ABI068_13230 [Ktedonobacterales bacterium]
MSDAETSAHAHTIARLPELIAALPAPERRLAERLFQVVVSEGVTVPPAEMAPWLEHTFGSVEAVLRQRIIRVTNRWTFEGATFNQLRSHRPNSGASQRSAEVPPEVRERIAHAVGDDFCRPETHTPADSFGRVYGRHSVTSANVAKADGWHGVAIFDQHDPLALDGELVADVLAVAGKWAALAHAADPAARHLFVLWNCLWRAGASLIHGHAQMTLSATMAQAKVELWRGAAVRYHSETSGDYFADLAAIYAALGLAFGGVSDGTHGFASLTPVKEREVTLLAPQPAATLAPAALPDALATLAGPLWQVLRVAREELGVLSFNVAVFGPPLAMPDDTAGNPADDAGWAGFPLVARFVDRGSPLSTTADVATLELFGSSVIASDPFDVARAMRNG